MGGPVGGEVGTATGGPVGGEVGYPDGSEKPAPAGLRRLQGEMNAPLAESQLVVKVGVLSNMQTTGKKDEHGTHLRLVFVELSAFSPAPCTSSRKVGKRSVVCCVPGHKV